MKRLTGNDIVNRAAQSDVTYWMSMNNGRCPNCCVKFTDLSADANLYPHMIGECGEPLVGINWIRPAQNVDAPMADAEARREVKVQEVTGRTLLYLAGFCLLLAAGLLWVMFR